MADEKIKKSLERKTKKELIEIIFRKDSVERELREINKDLCEINKNISEDKKKCETDIENQENAFLTLSAKHDELIQDYQNCCDENTSLYHDNKRYKKQIKLVATLLIIVSTMLILSLVL